MPRVKPVKRSTLPGDLDALVRLLVPTAIHDRAGYDNAMEMVDALTSLPKLTKDQSLYLDTLSILAEAYEDETEGTEPAGLKPLDVLRHLTEANDMTASDLGRLLGERSLGPKLLNGNRELSKSHIRTLCRRFNVSADLFI
jgi:antitoxin component HigA of HigAB toxin-antitoxin module